MFGEDLVAVVLMVCLSSLLGSLSNHDERDDDDVKYARRDWDENVAFGGKMKLKVAQNSNISVRSLGSNAPFSGGNHVVTRGFVR